MKSQLIDALIEVAEQRGFTVRWHRGGPKAAWLPQQNAVTLRHGMSDAETLCSLGDPAGHDPRYEARADRFAAKLLVSPVEYALAEQTYGPHPARIAHELGVTTHIVKVWRAMNERKIAV